MLLHHFFGGTLGQTMMHLGRHLFQERRENGKGIGPFNWVLSFRGLLSDGPNVCLARVGPNLECHSTGSYTKGCHAVLFTPAVERFRQGSAIVEYPPNGVS